MLLLGGKLFAGHVFRFPSTLSHVRICFVVLVGFLIVFIVMSSLFLYFDYFSYFSFVTLFFCILLLFCHGVPYPPDGGNKHPNITPCGLVMPCVLHPKKTADTLSSQCVCV